MARGPVVWGRQQEGQALSDELYGVRMEALWNAGGKFADIDPNSMVELASSNMTNDDMMEVFLGASNQVIVNDMRDKFKMMSPLMQVAEFANLPQQSQNLMLATGYEVPKPDEDKGLLERMATWDFPLIPEEYLPGILQAGLAPVRALGFLSGKVVSNTWETGVMKPSRFATHLGRTGLSMMDQHTSFAFGSPIPVADAGFLNPGNWMDQWNATQVDNDTYTKEALRAAEDLVGKERLDMLRLLRRDGVSGVEERFLEMGEARGESRPAIANAFRDWYASIENPAEQQAMQILDSGRRSLSDSIVRMYNAHPLLPDVRPGTAPANVIGGVGALTVEILLDPTTWLGTGYMKVWKASRAGIRVGVQNQQRVVGLYARMSRFVRAADDADFAATMGMQDMTQEAVETALKDTITEGAEAIPGRFKGPWARTFAPLARMATGHVGQMKAMNRFVDRINDVFKMKDAEDDIIRAVKNELNKVGAPDMPSHELRDLVAKKMLEQHPDLPQGLLENLLRDIPALREAIDHMIAWHRQQRTALAVIDRTKDMTVTVTRSPVGTPIARILVNNEYVEVPADVVKQLIDVGGGKFVMRGALPTLADEAGYWKFLAESTEGWQALQALGGTSSAATYLPKIGRFGQGWIKGKQFMNRVHDFGKHSDVLHANIGRMTGEFMAKNSGLANRLVSAAIKSGKYVDSKGKEVAIVLSNKVGDVDIATLLLEGDQAVYGMMAKQLKLTPEDLVKIEKARISLEVVARRQIIEEGHMDELFNWYDDIGFRNTKNDLIDTGKVPHRSATFFGGVRRARRNSLDYYRDNIHPPGSVNDDLGWMEQQLRKAHEYTPPEIKAGFATLAYYPAKFAKKLTTYVPRSNHIDVMDAKDAIREFSALVEMGSLAHMPQAKIDKYIRTFVMGNEAERWIVQTEFFMDFLGRSGALLHGGRDVQEYIKRFVRHGSARYALASDDVVSLHGVGLRRAVQVGADHGAELSRLNIIPSYRDLSAVARYMSFYRQIGWGTHIPHLDKLIARTWRPAVLLRLGYVARNGGEELFSWWLREGPAAWGNYRVAREAMGQHVVWDAYGRKLPIVFEPGEQVATVWRPFGRLWRSFNEIIGAGDYAVTQKALREIFTNKRFLSEAEKWDFLSDELRQQIFDMAHASAKMKVEQNLFFRLNREMFNFAESKAVALSKMLHDTGQALGIPTRREIARRIGIRLDPDFDKRIDLIELSLTNPTMQDQYMKNVLGVYDSYLSPHVGDLSAAMRQEGFGGSLHSLLKLPMQYTETRHVTSQSDRAIAASQKLDRSRDVPGERAIARDLAHHADDRMDEALGKTMDRIIEVDPHYRGPDHVGQAAKEAEVISPTPGIELPEIVEQVPKASPAEADLPLERIISGGQTGADQGGLFAAEELGIPTGGMGTKGFKVEGGHDVPLLRDRFGLVEHPSSNYPPRTRENIKQSDGTVIFYPGQGDAGTGLTERLAKELNKPYIIITGRSPASRQRFVDFLRDNNIRTLNVAGNRGSKGGPKFQENVQKFMVEAITEARVPKPAVEAVGASAAHQARIRQAREAGHTVSETRRTRRVEPEDAVNTHPMNKGDALGRSERGEQTATTRMDKDWRDAGGVPKPGEILLFRNKAGRGVYVRVTKVEEFPQQRKALTMGHGGMGPEAKQELKAINFTWDKEAGHWIPPQGADVRSPMSYEILELDEAGNPVLRTPEQIEEIERGIREMELDPWVEGRVPPEPTPAFSDEGQMPIRMHKTISEEQLRALMRYMGPEDLKELRTRGSVKAMGIKTELIPLNKDLELMEMIFGKEFDTVEEMVAHVRNLTARHRGKVVRVEYERLDEVDELVAQVYQGGTEVLEEIRTPGRPFKERMKPSRFVYEYLAKHPEARRVLSDAFDRAPLRRRMNILEAGEEQVQYMEQEPWEEVVDAVVALLPEEVRPIFRDMLHPQTGTTIEDVVETGFSDLVARPQTPGGVYGEGKWVETDGFQRWHADSGDIYVTPDEVGSMGYSEEFLREQRLSVLPAEAFPHTYESGGRFVAPVRGMDRTVIDLNQASAEELAQLPGIGAQMARRIIETREGLYFDTIDDLRRVPGLTDAKIKKITESPTFDAQAASPVTTTRQIATPERRGAMNSNHLAFLLADGVEPRNFTSDFGRIERGLVPSYETPMSTPHGQDMIRSSARANIATDPASATISDPHPEYVSRLFVPMIPTEYRGPLVQLLSEGGAEGSTFYDEFSLRLTRKFVDLGLTDVEAGRAARLIHPSTGRQPGVTALNYEILSRAWELENQVHFPLVAVSSDHRVARAIGETLEEMMQDLGIPMGTHSRTGISYLDVNSEALKNTAGITSAERALVLDDVTISLPRPLAETTHTASLADPGDIHLVDPFYSIGKDGSPVRSTDIPGGVWNERVIGLDTGLLQPHAGLVPVTMVNDTPTLMEVHIFVNKKTNQQVLVQARTAADDADGVLESIGERSLAQYDADPDWDLIDVQLVGGNSLADKTREFGTIASHEMRHLLTDQSRPGIAKPEVQHAWIREIRGEGEVSASRVHDHATWDSAPEDLIGMFPITDEGGGALERTDKFWQRLLTNWFDGVVNPMIGAMVREPMFNHYLLTAMDQTRGVRRIYFLKPKDTERMRGALRGHTALDDEGQVFIPQLEAFITKSWLGMTPDSDEAILGLARAIERGDPAELANYMENILETQLLSAEDENLFRAIYHMADSKDGTAATEFFNWAKNRKTRTAAHREVGLQRAFKLTGAYIDDHRIRSQFQQMVGTAIPFWFAEDNFLRRLGRGLEHNPMLLRNLHLTLDAGVYGGLIQEDQYGEQHLIIPGSEIAVEYMMEILDEFPIINKIFGGGLGAVGNPRLSTSLNIIPGYDKERMGQMGFGPLLSVPLSFAANRDPSIREPASGFLGLQGGFEANLVGNKFGSGSASDVVLGQIVPAVITRTLNSLGQNWPDPRAREKAKVDIVKFLAISGDLPTQEEIAASDAPELLMEEFLQKVDMMAQQYQLLQGLSWFFGPGTARLSDLIHHEGWEWNSEFISLLNAGIPYEEAYPMWIERIKKETGEFDPLMYSAFRLSGTNKRTFGVLEVTEESNRWLVSNEPFVRQFGLSSSFFMPRGFDSDDDDFSSEAKSRLVNYGMRYHKTTAEVVTELYYKASYPEYHRNRVAYLKNRYALLAKNRDVTMVDRKWHAWAKSWGQQNPVFAARIASGTAGQVRDDTIHEFELLLAAPALIPDGEYKDDLLIAMQIITEVNGLFRELANVSGSRAKARRDNARYQSYVFMHEFVQGRPWLNEMYYSVFLPLIGETWLAKLEAGMPDIPRSIEMAA